MTNFSFFFDNFIIVIVVKHLIIIIIIIIIVIKHKYVHIFILWLMSLLVYNSNYGLNNAGLPRVQQSMFYLYPKLLQLRGGGWVHMCNHMYAYRSGSYTRFTLYAPFPQSDYDSDRDIARNGYHCIP